MDLQCYSESIFSISSCSPSAFKEGKAFGTCLQFQQSIEGQHRSTQQANKMWRKKTTKN